MTTVVKLKCERCGKTFPSVRALLIHSEVAREDGVLATLIVKPKEENKADA